MSLALVHHTDYTIALPAQHPFPMQKFAVLRNQLKQFDHRIQWHEPDEIPFDALSRVHCPHFLTALLNNTLDARAQRRSGFSWSAELIRRVRLETGGTLLAAQLALRDGLALNTAGGTHHAHAAYASGYCLINDLAVVAASLIAEGQVKQILILDLDVHQGDGTARLLAGEPRAFTCSIHAARNFPADKALSDCDIALPDGTDDQAYLAMLGQVIPPLLDQLAPDLVIYDAGVDVHAGDRLGHLALTDSGIFSRDRWVINTVRDAGIPLVGVIGGGYDRDISQLVARHLWLFKAALDYA